MMALKVIDISYAQGKVDFEAVRENVDGVIIRCGYGDDITDQDDAWWERNASECERLGIPYGAYLYSYAMSQRQAESETNHILRLIRGRKLAYPVYIDLEYEPMRQVFRPEWFIEMGEKIEESGYWFGIYANLDWFRSVIGNRLDRFTRWAAQYNDTLDTYADMWQYTNKGRVAGISGNCDMNICYRNLPDEIRRGWQTDSHLSDTDEAWILETAMDVIRGDYGNGEERRRALGSRYEVVQRKVNELMEKNSFD